jgi:ABC-type Zn uptake system ZnuABC Zn-binding protein ZnuA
MRFIASLKDWGRCSRSAAMTVSACIGTAACLLVAHGALAAPIQLVASNSIYVDLAEQLGGRQIAALVPDRKNETVSGIQSNSIVLCGSTRRDAWLRDAARRTLPPAMVVEVPQSRFEEDDDDQVPWYDVEAIGKFTHALARELTRREPSMAPGVTSSLAHADMGFREVSRRIDEIAKDYANSDVIVADGLSRAIANRLNFKANPRMDMGTTPTRTAVTEAIQRREGVIFLYDRDAAGPAVKELVDAANDAGIPVVGLQERLPRGLHFQQWALRQWNAIHGALNEASP